MSASAAFAPQGRSKLPLIVGLPLVLFLWVLPFHATTIAFFFGVLRTSIAQTTLLAAWKEGVAVFLILLVSLRVITSRGPRAVICAPDVAVTGLIGFALVYAFSENFIFAAGIPPKVELFGFRSSIFFMLLYYVGRGTPELSEKSIGLKHIFYVAFVVSTLGVLERIFVGPDMLVALGAASYMNDFLGLTATTVDNNWRLPSNYWSTLGGVSVRRAGSVFLGGQAFALPFLLMMPAATFYAFDAERTRKLLVRLAYFVIWAGLLVTITRVTIIVCVLQLILYFLMTRRLGSLASAAIIMAGFFFAALAVVPGLLSFVFETITFQTASSYSHLNDWRSGVLAFLERPWGYGLGSSDMAATRFGRTPITADNMFLGYAVDLGLIGFVLHLLVLATIAIASFQLFRTSADSHKRNLGGAIFLATIGVALNENSSATFNSIFLAYNLHLFAGVAVSAKQIDERQAAAQG